METLIWKPEKLHFRNAALDAWVVRSPRSSVLERERKTLESTLAMDAIAILRQPPLPFADPYSDPQWEKKIPDKELWKIPNLGSFDSIRFAKAVFNSPEDKYFLEGVDSLEAIIAMLSEGFAEGDFRLVSVNDSILLFHLTKPNTKVTRRQYTLLDKLNDRFFTGPHMKVAQCCIPTSFIIGDIGTM